MIILYIYIYIHWTDRDNNEDRDRCGILGALGACGLSCRRFITKPGNIIVQP